MTKNALKMPCWVLRSVNIRLIKGLKYDMKLYNIYYYGEK